MEPHGEAPLRVAVVEDQPLFRSMLVDLLSAQPDLVVVGSADTVASARALLQPETVDVVVLDIELPDGNGFGLGLTLRAAQPDLGIVLLSSHDLVDVLLELKPNQRGGWSYLSKASSTSPGTVLRAVHVSARGGTVIDPALTANLTPRRGSPLEPLAPRQLRALRLLSEGLSNAAIAREMQVSTHAIDNLLNTVYTQLGVRTDRDRNPRVTATLLMLEHSRSVPGSPGASIPRATAGV
jgi:DNA-binding NarL/FixJ family response regulator